MNLRVSVTAIDSWLFTMSHEDSRVEDLLAGFRGEGQRTEPMIASSALHKALESAEPGLAMNLEADGYRFVVKPDIELALPPIRELKLESEIPMDGLTVTLVGKVDGMDGRTVFDYKGTKRFEPEYFLDSFQWKQYLNATGADIFEWRVFVVNWENWTEFGAGKSFNITDYHELKQFRYPGMKDDCMDLLKEFLSFLDVKALDWPSEDCTLMNLLKANR